MGIPPPEDTLIPLALAVLGGWILWQLSQRQEEPLVVVLPGDGPGPLYGSNPKGVSTRGVNFVKRWEGLSLVAYDDGTGTLTIGYGHTGPDVKPGMRIDKLTAERLLMRDLMAAAGCVLSRIKVPLAQHQLDALASFVFNVGCPAFTKSTLLRKLNAGDYQGAAEELDRWVYATINGKKTKLLGLQRRRAAEKRLFLTGEYS